MPHTATKDLDRTAACHCPACLGLQCLERPRFFAGQLLTESELDSEQAYVLAKHRLHNRYLHGPGVVCGLEVACNDCEGYVTVSPGYAIDPCGNDIVVCEEQSFNLIGAIRTCSSDRRRRRRGDCDPYEPTIDPGCRDIEEHWCVTIAFDEKEGRPVAPLRREKACKCRSSNCGCGGRKNGGNGGNGGSSKCCSSGSTATPPAETPGCEATRILESFRLGAIEEPKNKCGSLLERLESTLLMRLVRCFTSLVAYLRERMPENELLAVLAAFADSPGSTDANGNPIDFPAAVTHAGMCRFRQAMLDLFLDDPANVRCTAARAIDQVACPPPDDGESDAHYRSRMHEPASQLLGFLTQHLLDCICHEFLPPCGPDPGDNRIILACVTIRDCKVIRICNFSCRRHAGAFPSLYHWLSLIPIGTLAAFALSKVCCLPDLVRKNSPLVNDLDALLNLIDPTGNVRGAFVANKGALPRSLGARVRRLPSELVSGAARALLRQDGVNLVSLHGRSVADAQDVLDKALVSVVRREVASAAKIPAARNLLASPFAGPGDTVVLYSTRGTVSGFGRYSTRERLADKDAEISAMRDRVAALAKDVEELKRRSPNKR